jgi:RNA polymerase sigma-70 factor (sigma-E family)
MAAEDANGDDPAAKARNDEDSSSVHTSMDALTLVPELSVVPARRATVLKRKARPVRARAAEDTSPVSIWHPELIRVYEERYDDFVRLAYLITGQGPVAEEIVQDAFIAAHRSWDKVRDPAPYVRAAVTNRCYSWGRRLKLERERRPQPPDPAELVADEMWDALAALNHRQRTAIVLRYYADLPDKEIADILGCRTATVRTTIHRGLRSLRKVIEP